MSTIYFDYGEGVASSQGTMTNGRILPSPDKLRCDQLGPARTLRGEVIRLLLRVWKP